MQTVKDLSVDELRELIGQVVEEKFRELLVDPDEGLSPRPEVEKRLRASLNESPDWRNTISATDVANRFNAEPTIFC